MYYGVGYMLNFKHSDNPRGFSIWQGMLRRCYDETHVRFNRYGGRGVVVSERWKCFDYFLEDLDKIDGWDSELFESKKIVLDKDKKDFRNLVYSKDTCTWISKEENNSLRNSSPLNVKPFKAVSPEGVEYNETNQKEFCERFGLDRGSVNRVLKGHRNHHKEWKFYYS